MLARFTSRRVAVTAIAANCKLPSSSVGLIGRRWCETKAEEEKKEGTEEKPKEEKKIPDHPASSTATKRVQELEEKLKDKEAELKEMKTKMLYALAEADTARRVGREDVAKAKDYAVTSFAKDMLEVSDTLNRSLDATDKLTKEELEGHPALVGMITGVKMSRNVLEHNLGRHGVEKMEVKVGDEFDPNKHEALFNAPPSETCKTGSIANVIKIGYNIRDRVLRAAQVGVAGEAQ